MKVLAQNSESWNMYNIHTVPFVVGTSIFQFLHKTVNRKTTIIIVVVVLQFKKLPLIPNFPKQDGKQLLIHKQVLKGVVF